MATIKYTANLGDLGTLRFDYSPSETHTIMEASNGNNAVYVDGNGGEMIVLKGHDFAYLDGELLTGRVNKIIFQDEEGHMTAVTSGVDISAKQLNKLLTSDSLTDIQAFLNKIASGHDEFKGSANADLAWTGKGDDIVKGFGGDDSINGQRGDDFMIGGQGSDTFFFMLGGEGGHDVVKDFDAVGGGLNQDYVGSDFEQVLSIKQVGDDLVLNYGGGHTLTLLDVDKSDFGKEDFHMPA